MAYCVCYFIRKEGYCHIQYWSSPEFCSTVQSSSTRVETRGIACSKKLLKLETCKTNNSVTVD